MRRVRVLEVFFLLLPLLTAAPANAVSEADRLWLVGTHAFEDRLYALAEKMLDRFVQHHQKDPRAPDAVLLLGKTRLALGSFERAIEDFRRAQRFPTPPGQPREAQFWEGETLFQLKRYPEARATYETVVRTPSSPLAPDAYYGLGWVALQQTQPEAAVRAFRQLLAGWPTHRLASFAAYYLARTLADLKRPAEVSAVLAGYETAYPDSPWLAEVLYLRGWSQLSTGQFEVATNTLQSFLARAPTHELAPQAQLQLAEALLRQGKKAEGLQQLQLLLTASPTTTPELLYDIGQLSQRFDFPAEAQQAWHRLGADFARHPLAFRASLESARTAFLQELYPDALAAATTAAASADLQLRLHAYLLIGDSQLQLKRHREAQAAYETVVRTPSSPLAPDAYYGLGWAALQQTQREAAVRAFRQLLAGWPTHRLAPSAAYYLARTLADLKRPDEVRSALAGYETAYPDSPWLAEVLYLRGWSQLSTGQFEVATNTLQSFLARAPTHELTPQAQLQLAEALLRQGKKAEGLQQLRTLLTASPTTPELLYDIGQLSQRLDFPAEAQQAWGQLQTQFPTHPLARRASLELARAAFAQQRYADAAAAATTAATSDDREIRLHAYLLIGDSQLQLKRYPEAQAAYETMLRTPSSPLAPDAYYGLGWAALQQTQREAAVRAFRQLLAGWPTHRLASSAAYYLARTLADLKHPDEVGSALAGYETAYPDSPWLAEVLYLRGWSQLSTGQFEVATNTLQSFLARAPTHELTPQAQLQLAEALLRQGKKAEGLQQLRTLLTASPRTPELLYDIGQLSQRLDFPAEAQQAWGQLQTQFPTHPLARRASLELARGAFAQQRYADAVAAATTAAASDDREIRLQAYLLVGDSQLRLERYTAALRAFRTVTEESPRDHPLRLRALAGRALAHEHLEQWGDAVRIYQLVTSGSDEVLKKWARERLQAINARRKPADSSKTPGRANKLPVPNPRH